MAEQKIFAGPRIRRIRTAKGLTQTAMAAGLGISPSYLNLIERNQRPLTVQLILKLASVYHVEPDELQAEAAGSLAALRAVFADPLLAGELPGDQELIELAEAAPNAAAAMIKLHRAYREQAGRLSDLSSSWRARAAPRRCPARACRSTRCARPSSRGPTTSPRWKRRRRRFRSCSSPGDDLAGALEGVAEARTRDRSARAAGRHHAELAAPLRPPFAAPVPVGAAVALRPIARDRHGGLPAAHAGGRGRGNRGAEADHPTKPGGWPGSNSDAMPRWR